jgi:hypothetical protein
VISSGVEEIEEIAASHGRFECLYPNSEYRNPKDPNQNCPRRARSTERREAAEEREEGRIRAPTGVVALRIRPAFAGRRIGNSKQESRTPKAFGVRPSAPPFCGFAALREESALLHRPSPSPSPLGISNCPPWENPNLSALPTRSTESREEPDCPIGRRKERSMSTTVTLYPECSELYWQGNQFVLARSVAKC